MFHRTFRLCVLVLLTTLAALLTPSPAEPDAGTNNKAIPETLKPWISWSIWDDKQRDCPSPYSDPSKRICFWPSRLTLNFQETGGHFDLAVSVYAETWVPLPGSADRWPVGVSSDGAPLAVVEHTGAPSVRLSPGVHRLEGAYRWNELPQSIPLPQQIGVLTLTVEGKAIEAPTWSDGVLWLRRDASQEETNAPWLSLKEYAQLSDGNPLWLKTNIDLQVSGKSREEDLGTVLPQGWRVTAVESPIPVAIDDAARMKAQVRAGTWTITLTASRLDNPQELRFAEGAKPAAEEILIGFRAEPEFRTAELTGAPTIDVSQTTFPQEWLPLPVYRWTTAQPLRLEERMCGAGEQKVPGLKIHREWWLDEDGQGLTFRDRISGTMQKIWRLDTLQGEALGAVRSGGQGQLITRNPVTGTAGVELRTRSVDLEATGRIDRRSALSAAGWNTDTDALSVTLNLPPGWRLFALFGADWIEGAWLTSWTLLDLFLLLVFSLAIYRLNGLAAAVLAFVAFSLAYHEPGAPRFVWLAILVPLALLRVVPEGRGRTALLGVKWVVLAALVLLLVPFLAQQAEQVIYPQLEDAASYRARSPVPANDFETTGATLASAPAAPKTTGSRIQRKLDTILLPKIEFREATLQDALDQLQRQSASLDTAEPDPTKRGVKFTLKVDPLPTIPGLESSPDRPADPTRQKITVSLSNIPLGEALRYVTGLANLQFRVEPDGVSIVPQGTPTESLITKEYEVAPGFLGSIPSAGSPSAVRGGSGIAVRAGAKDFLSAQGVAFPPGSSAIYLPSSGKLIVRNTPENFNLVDSMIEASAAGPVTSSNAGDLRYDPGARIQTGPAVPEWSWRIVSFGWNGPVQASQQIHPLLISRGLERGLTVLRVVLLLALAAVLLGAKRLALPRFRFRGHGGPVAMGLFFLLVSGAGAQIPDQSMLNKLRERLLEPSDAYPTAADIPMLTLRITEQRITTDAEIHAAVRTAVPLPGRLETWSPISVVVDGKPEPALRRDDGFLWVVLEAGVHKVRVEGMITNSSEWQWSFRLKPHQVTIEAPDWTVTGLRPDGLPEEQLFLTRKVKTAEAAATYERQEYQTIVKIERQVTLGLTWKVSTTVSRLTETAKAVALRVPLLPGESVLASDGEVKDGMIEVRLPADLTTITWESNLPITDHLNLTTRPEDTWVEQWRLTTSPVWNVSLNGLAPIFQQGTSELVPTWQPWPGESVELAISRPMAIAGPTTTVSKGEHQITLGKRQRTSRLNITLRSSLGEDFALELPQAAEVTSLTHNGKSLPVRKDGSRVVIPLHPGDQALALEWKDNTPLGTHVAADRVVLPVDSANLTTTIDVPQDRWVLWAYGPLRGPAVRLWGILIAAALAALVLTRIPWSPLRALEWVLLTIGLTQVPLVAALLVIGWLFLLAWRGHESVGAARPWCFNLFQLLLITLTVAALGVLLQSVGKGLLGSPEMFIAGNGSTRTALHWYQPRSGTTLPMPGMISVSIWWYRLLMLLWALWLATAVMRWLRWGWENFSRGGIFRRKPAADTPPPLAGRTSA